MDDRSAHIDADFYASFKTYHELMAKKIKDVVLVSSPYDAYILDEDGSMAAKIISEYSGLNLSQPPRITRIATAREALAYLTAHSVDLVITMPQVDDMDAFSFGAAAKEINPTLPVVLLAHHLRAVDPDTIPEDRLGIDRVFLWRGNADLLLALVKNVEDGWNVAMDTRRAGVRVLLLVEDSPVYQSVLLPLIYKEVVRQTQAVLADGLNAEHRLLKMRARPKILLAETYEAALELYDTYQPYMLGVLTDTRFCRDGACIDDAGHRLADAIRERDPNVPVLVTSTDDANRTRAEASGAMFLHKRSGDLASDLHKFFLDHLGFGDFVFRGVGGEEIGRAATLGQLERKLDAIPDACIENHARRNHFSNWIISRSETALGATLRRFQADDFSSADEMRQFLKYHIHAMRRLRQKGVITQYRSDQFDADVMAFAKIGTGAIGGKARGLAFMSALLHQAPDLHSQFDNLTVRIPAAVVLCTDIFEAFVEANGLADLHHADVPDDQVTQRCLAAQLPDNLIGELAGYLTQVHHPLSVRSSSLLEDAQFRPYAGLYETYMIPNNHPDPDVRLDHLGTAIKLVFASTFYQGPKAFSRHTSGHTQSEAMAVMIQELSGRAHGEFFYPAISGVAQSHNFYPLSPMTADDGIAHIALGFGRTVVMGEQSLRFCPRYPTLLPQFASVDATLTNAQQYFYALRISGHPEVLDYFSYANLVKRDVDEAENEYPVRRLGSVYSLDDHRIRDTSAGNGARVLTFAGALKYDQIPLPGMLDTLLQMGREGMGCPVEIEFAVDIDPATPQRAEFHLLQIRPMVASGRESKIRIFPAERDMAWCVTGQSLGNGEHGPITDVIYVKPDAFDPKATEAIAEEIGRLNGGTEDGYVLAGPGRWGTADRWLGIPVRWEQISNAEVMVEVRNAGITAEPSQGTHFFQNITSLGIPYLTITEGAADAVFDWDWLTRQSVVTDTPYVRRVRVPGGIRAKVDGRSGAAVLIADTP